MLLSKKIFLLGFLQFLFVTSVLSEEGLSIPITTANQVLVFKVDKNHKLRQCYYGSKLNSSDYSSVQTSAIDAYPTFGTSYINEAALRVVHADGNTSTELVYDSYSTEKVADGVELAEIDSRSRFE